MFNYFTQKHIIKDVYVINEFAPSNVNSLVRTTIKIYTSVER